MDYENNTHITIIGGSKGLGKWIAKLLIKNNYPVTITSRNMASGKKIADEINATYNNDNIDAVKKADVIIFSVPIEHMVETIKEVAPHAKKNSLLMDVTSVKINPSEALLKYAPKDCEILPCHPMFGPRIPSLDGQVVILTPLKDKCNTWYNRIVNFLEENNTDIVISSPEEHDLIMSVVQGLTHFSYISIASTINRLNISVKQSRKFASPVYSLMLDMISRIVSQNPYLYYSIQKSNELTSFAREILIDESIKLSTYIDNDDEKEFINSMRESAKHLDEFEEALGRSDKAISFLTHDLKYLKESIGKEIGLKHQYSKNVHIGIIKDVDAKNVVLCENNKDVKLKISNVNILTQKQLFEWKRNNCKLYSFDISLLVPENVDKNIFTDFLSRIDNVVGVKLIDEYRDVKFDGKISMTFNYSTFNKEDRFGIEEYIKGLGFIIR